jgi:hypothetical protein
MSAIDLSGNVIISIERLRKLEALEADIPNIVAKAKADAYVERLEMLRVRDKENPEAHRKRTADWKKAHREEINAKRREQYKLKKEAAAAAAVETSKTPGV